MASEAKISSGNTDSSGVRKTVNEEEESRYEYVIVPPDGGYGWIVTGASLMCLLISDGILFSLGLLRTELTQLFDVSVAKVAWIFSIFNGSSLISGPIASALCNRFGFRAVVIAGSLVGFVGLLTSSFAKSIDTLFFTLGVLVGVADGLVYTPIVVVVGFYFDKKRALATGIALCGSGAGGFIFAPVIYLLLETYTISGAFLILGGIYLNCAVHGSLLIPLKPQRRMKLQEGVNLIDDVASSIKETQRTLNEVEAVHEHVAKAQGQLGNERINSGQQEQQSVGWFVPSVYLTAYAIKMGIPKAEASFLLSVIGISNMIGRIFKGWLSDRPRVNVLLLNNIGLSGAGVLITLCPLFCSYEVLVVFAALFGLVTSCTTVTRPILLGKLLGLENVNNGYSFMLLFNGMASLSGIPLAGFLYDIFGDYHVAFYLAGCSILVSAFICYPLGRINRWEKRRRSKN